MTVTLAMDISPPPARRVTAHPSTGLGARTWDRLWAGGYFRPTWKAYISHTPASSMPWFRSASYTSRTPIEVTGQMRVSFADIEAAAERTAGHAESGRES